MRLVVWARHLVRARRMLKFSERFLAVSVEFSVPECSLKRGERHFQCNGVNQQLSSVVLNYHYL